MLKQFTATGYVCAKVNGEIKVLLHLHKKIGIWLGIGGHIEPYENPMEAALREIREETGINVAFYNPNKSLIQTEFVTELVAPVMLLEEKISARPNEPAHCHIDLIYFATTTEPEKVRMKEKFGWFSLPELKDLDLTPEVRYNAENAIHISTPFIKT